MTGAVAVRPTSLETVRSETATPNVANSPWMRGAPQSGFAAAIFTTRARRAVFVRGRPGRVGREHRVQRRRNHWRCQRTTVSGCTTTMAVRHCRHTLTSSNPKQPIVGAGPGTLHRALEHCQLLTQCQILERDRPVSCAYQKVDSLADALILTRM